MMRFLCLLILFVPSLLWSQQNEIIGEGIRTLRVEKDGVLSVLPTLKLNSTDRIEVSFDEMSHEYHRYVYTVEHCGFDWKPSEGLFESEYLRVNRPETLIEDYEESRNTTSLYTHYSFIFPNKEVRPLLSGNYRLTIFDETEDEPMPVAKVYFCVVEPLAGVSASVSANTDVDWNRANQQVSMTVSVSGLQLRDAREEIKTVVLQNHRIDNAVINPKLSYVNGDRLIWEYQRDLIFPAGNEFRKFEMLSTQYPGLRIEKIRWIDPFYHAEISTDLIRRNYLYDEDQLGISVIRNVDNQENATESEYVITHFTLDCDRLPDDEEVYVNGLWASPAFSPEYRMEYDEELHAYRASLYLKQGYYNYQYLVRKRGDSVGRTAPTEGDYYQTTNEYSIYVYCRTAADRYDRLVGVANVRN